MKVLAIGDVIAQSGCDFIRKNLSQIKKENNIDLCIINGENSATGNGISKNSAEGLLSYGADILTTGNHVYHRRDAYDFLDSCSEVIRPYNFYGANPGRGYAVFNCQGYDVVVANLIGRVYLDGGDNPFLAADKLLKEVSLISKTIIIDFHAEATSEKIAMAHYLDGRASLLFGTHTHVQTADEMIFPKGLGYITDLGMTGPKLSILGLDAKNIVERFVTGMPARFENSQNDVVLNGIIADIDLQTGKTVKIERIVV